MAGSHRRSPRRGAVVLTAVALVLGGAGGAMAAARHELRIRATDAASASAADLPGSTGAPSSTPSATPATPSATPATVSGGAVQVAAAGETPTPTPTVVPASTTYRVVGLGDSVPAGTACSCAPYVTLVGQEQAQVGGLAASIDNLSVAGLTTAGLLAQLDDPGTAAAVAQADLVIVTIGANDFDESAASDRSCAPPELSCYRSALAQQATELDAVLARIATVSTVSTRRVVVTGYWNVFLDGVVGRDQGRAYVAASDALTVADNAVIAAASSRGGDRYVDLYAPFKGDGSIDDTDLLADDGDHPDAAGHALIASTIEAALR